MPDMGGLGAVISHPIWAACSLVLAVALWVRRWWRWSPGACPVDLSGKTAIVTGANSGIGKFVALDLARRNARTILACRSLERGQAALEEIRRATGNAQVQLRILDTSSMASVRDFARRFLEEEKRLDILVNNAGATGLPHTVTAEGLELTFATNFLGPFLLTNLLLDAMKASAPTRIVNVSSYMHYWGKLDLKFLTGEEPLKNRSHVYNSTKLMNVVFTAELDRRLRGTGVSVNALHPGVIKTEIMRYYSWWPRLLYSILGFLFLKGCHLQDGASLFSAAPENRTQWSNAGQLQGKRFHLKVWRDFFTGPREGATSTLYCAVSKEVEGISGKYFDSDCSLALPLALAEDPAVGRKLWEASEKLTGLGRKGQQVGDK